MKVRTLPCLWLNYMRSSQINELGPVDGPSLLETLPLTWDFTLHPGHVQRASSRLALGLQENPAEVHGACVEPVLTEAPTKPWSLSLVSGGGVCRGDSSLCLPLTGTAMHCGAAAREGSRSGQATPFATVTRELLIQ